MIKGVHTMLYSSDAFGLRNFLCDKLNLEGTDMGGGWLIFDILRQISVVILRTKNIARHPAHTTFPFIVIILSKPLTN